MRRILLGGRRGRESAVAIVAALACCGPGAALAQTPSVAIRPPDPGTTVGGVVKDIADAARPVTDAAGQAAGAAANTTAAATTGPLTDTLQQATAGTAPPAGGAHGSPARDAAPAPEHVTPQPGDDPANVPGAAAVPARGSDRAASRISRGRRTTRRHAPARRAAPGHEVRRRAAHAARPSRAHDVAPSRTPHRTVFSDVAHAAGAIVERLPDWSRPIIAGLLALLLLAGARAFLNGRRARRLEGARLALRADIEILQAALVPALPDRIGGIELSVAYRPADGLASGGDFYDAFSLDEHRTAIILGDVSGHDRHAIGRAAAVRHKLRAYVEIGLEPRKVLHAAGEALADDSGDFATAAVAIHDARDGTLTYACAAHPPPILTGPATHEPVSGCASAPLGWGLPTGRSQTTVVLGEGTRACFFTDGFTEARADGAFLGREGFERLVVGLGATGTATDLVDALTELSQPVSDDLAVLIVDSITPITPASVRIEEVELDADDVSRHATERFLASCGARPCVIEELVATVETTVEEAGHAVMSVRVDAQTAALEARVERVEQSPVGALAGSVSR